MAAWHSPPLLQPTVRWSNIAFLGAILTATRHVVRPTLETCSTFTLVCLSITGLGVVFVCDNHDIVEGGTAAIHSLADLLDHEGVWLRGVHHSQMCIFGDDHDIVEGDMQWDISDPQSCRSMRS